MPKLLSKKAAEEGTYIITAEFVDDDGDSVAPDTLTWTLTDSSGTVINSRTSVSVSSPTSSEDIVLSGNDLALQTGESGDTLRLLTVEATYDSDAGLDLPLKDVAFFYIKDFKAIT
jgi:hypothetical protein